MLTKVKLNNAACQQASRRLYLKSPEVAPPKGGGSGNPGRPNDKAPLIKRGLEVFTPVALIRCLNLFITGKHGLEMSGNGTPSGNHVDMNDEKHQESESTGGMQNGDR